MLLFLVGAISLVSCISGVGGAPTGTVDVTLSPKPQPFSWLGFYDTLFPIEMTVVVYNPTDRVFPGGNLTGRVESPSGWYVSLSYNVSTIAPREWRSYDLSFEPQESGVYMVKLDEVEVPLSMTLQEFWEVSGGFRVIQVEPPSTLLQSLTVFLIGILALVLLALTIMLRRGVGGIAGSAPRPAAQPDLWQVFNRFEAGKRMENYLLRDKDDRKFESAVSWLLEIVGFRAMKLNKDARGEAFREGEAVVGSADILAQDTETGRLLVVDCTVGLVDTDRLQSIANLRNRLGSQGVFCDPVIVSSENADLKRKEGRSLGVTVVDRTDLEAMTTFVKAGRFDKAKKLLEQ